MVLLNVLVMVVPCFRLAITFRSESVWGMEKMKWYWKDGFTKTAWHGLSLERWLCKNITGQVYKTVWKLREMFLNASCLDCPYRHQVRLRNIVRQADRQTNEQQGVWGCLQENVPQRKITRERCVALNLLAASGLWVCFVLGLWSGQSNYKIKFEANRRKIWLSRLLFTHSFATHGIKALHSGRWKQHNVLHFFSLKEKILFWRLKRLLRRRMVMGDRLWSKLN